MKKTYLSLTGRTWVRLRRVTQVLFLALFVWLFLKAEFGGPGKPGLAGGPVLSLRPPDPGGPTPDLQPPGGRALLVPGHGGPDLHPGPVFLRLGLSPGHDPGRGPAAAVYGAAGSRRGGPVAPGEVLPAGGPAGGVPLVLESGGAVRPPVPALPHPGHRLLPRLRLRGGKGRAHALPPGAAPHLRERTDLSILQGHGAAFPAPGLPAALFHPGALCPGGGGGTPRPALLVPGPLSPGGPLRAHGPLLPAEAAAGGPLPRLRRLHRGV